MLKKKEAFTVITPIPSFIPRQLAIDILHAHSEVITLNPLVLDHKPIPAPRDAAADEFYSTWYEIHQSIQIMPGVGKFGASKISFVGCFHDMPWGLQTHTYGPLGVDLRIRYTVAGNQPGIEPPEQRELGLEALGAPKDGLYLRQDIDLRANISLISFTKAQLKSASKDMVQRIIRKAELVDAGVLQAMMQDGRLKTVNTLDRSQSVNQGQGLPSPNAANTYVVPRTSNSPGYPPYGHPSQTPQPGQYGMASPGPYQQQFQVPPNSPPPPGSDPTKLQPTGPHAVAIEMPGDFYHQQGQQPQPGQMPHNPQHYQQFNQQMNPHQSPPQQYGQQPPMQQAQMQQLPQSFAAELPANEKS
jgi:hypothetical protein